MRRLTDEQYRNSISDVFGTSIKIGGRLDPLVRTGGLIALGARSAPITPSVVNCDPAFGAKTSVARMSSPLIVFATFSQSASVAEPSPVE